MTAKVMTFPNHNDAGTLQRTYLLPLDKLDATAAPGVNDDDTAGFVAGSRWADRTNDKVWFCTDNATGAATWVEAGGSGGSGDVTAASAFGTDNRVIRSDGTGKGVQASSMTIEDTGDATVSGTITASNLSGTNTGDQTITLTGDVTGSGTGSFAATIANDAVTYAKMQDVAATARVLGRKTAGSGDPEECTLSEVLDFVGSAAQGDILYRGAAAWARLAAGTSGHFLKTFGAGADPAWAAASGGAAWTESSKSASWTVDSTTHVLYRVSVGGGNVTATLPAVSGNTGLVIAFKLTIQSGTNAFTIDGDGSEQIDSELTCVLRTLDDFVILICDGASGWRIVSDGRAKNWTVSAKSADFTAGVVTNTAYHVDVSGASRTATLPAASGNDGLVLEFKLTTAPAGNTLTIDGNGSETIDGATTLVLYLLNDFVVLLCDGSNWKVIVDGLRPHQCMITNNAAQTLSNVTWTLVTFNTEESDEAGLHSTSSNTDRITIRRAGNYILCLYLVFATNTTGARQIAFNKNGSGAGMPGNSVANPGTGEVLMSTTAPLKLAAGDYINVYAYQASGGNLNINTHGSPQGLIMSIFEQR